MARAAMSAPRAPSDRQAGGGLGANEGSMPTTRTVVATPPRITSLNQPARSNVQRTARKKTMNAAYRTAMNHGLADPPLENGSRHRKYRSSIDAIPASTGMATSRSDDTGRVKSRCGNRPTPRRSLESV